MSGSVAIVGVGGLGAPAAAALAAAGIGRLSLFDFDVVEPSNLPRQPLYGTGDVGRPKAEVAAHRLGRAHAGLVARATVTRLDAATAPAAIAGHDAVIDATDGIAAKAMLNEAALAVGVPLVHAGAVGLEGQLLAILPHRSACLRCLFVELPGEADLPTCQQSGILGPVVGAIGLAAAREALAIARGGSPHLADRLAILSAAHLSWRVVELRPNPRCPSCRAAG